MLFWISDFELQGLVLLEKWKLLLHYAVKLLFYLLNIYILNKLLLNLVLELLKLCNIKLENQQTSKECYNRSVCVKAYNKICVYIYVTMN